MRMFVYAYLAAQVLKMKNNWVVMIMGVETHQQTILFSCYQMWEKEMNQRICVNRPFQKRWIPLALVDHNIDSH